MTMLFKFNFPLQECPSGVVNEETFKHIYAQFFPHGDASTYAHYLFNAFDSTNNGSIKFESEQNIPPFKRNALQAEERPVPKTVVQSVMSPVVDWATVGTGTSSQIGSYAPSAGGEKYLL
ncbi:uncharacterized protein LOC114792962 isoform X1 [Denticeps clupeoides]|uniref:uncharacterized protein LOC114792962 isoform X1 n=1 Tax=Denticeps clupeoides TaxID=299321 RepID=UPI0010A59002|nr:uncharacterized protein LOC114792962 isoform X1 [Denticeps clupeoides]XP_028840344.1 uncharacterized protein LOC114792962 isoform X1 [Denticeps clupeoides]XP_028840345.1 uncharacterized protein LOC114792962 isoform X1 [Denticeps clupeoides]